MFLIYKYLRHFEYNSCPTEHYHNLWEGWECSSVQ